MKSVNNPIKISIRPSRLKDASRFFAILSNPNFKYLSVRVKSLRDEVKWLRTCPDKRRKNIEWNYAILANGLVIGAVGIKINRARPHIGEIGYFLEEKYWGQGLTTRAVKLIEREAFTKLGISRLEIVMPPENRGSERVAIKNNYQKEGLLRKLDKDKQGKLRDFWLYAKVR